VAASPAQLRYLADAANTASPARLIVMLYDRLLLDINRAMAAQDAGDDVAAREQLSHASQIVSELLGSLDTSGVWAGAGNLASLYVFLINELMTAGLAATPGRLVKCRQIVFDLRSAWQQAEVALTTPSAASTAGPAEARPAAWVG
jgi:flagellar protein FliS